MPPKKDAKKKAGAEDEINYTDVVLKNYKKACTSIGLTPHEDLMTALVPEEDDGTGIGNLCFDKDLGPGGIRAFCAAVLGRGASMEHHAYKSLVSLRLWATGIEDAGMGSLAQLLLAGPAFDVKLTHLEVMDDAIGPAGCRAIGDALMLGGNATLMTLRLDLNKGILDAGAIELCKGLRTNRTLSTLTLSFCGITEAAVPALAEVLTSPFSNLTELDLRGNSLKSEGLLALSESLMGNTKLETLHLADNGIGASTEEVNRTAIEALGTVLAAPAETSKVCRVDMEMNTIAEDDAVVLASFLGPENTKVLSFKVDSSLPGELFDKLFRSDAGKKKGKGKKKKGKKKG
ncbi:hypothetical protein FNF27_03141 [Cafeteria roenbergensis]|uniref:Uncharacterized protein n=1 Tax=Cafeteria roenbergensis TaxID=33653 RepID=A0A5A8EI31_CAFRO|nr:hypothetical protein FNF27_03141 [Cafeteria roenbergensis]